MRLTGQPGRLPRLADQPRGVVSLPRSDAQRAGSVADADRAALPGGHPPSRLSIGGVADQGVEPFREVLRNTVEPAQCLLDAGHPLVGPLGTARQVAHAVGCLCRQREGGLDLREIGGVR